MRYIKDLSGIAIPQVTNIPINAATNVIKGAYLSLSSGLAIAATNSLSTKVAGVSESGHNGVNDTLAPWNYATNLRVYTSPLAVFGYPAPIVNATTNSTTNKIEATGIANFVNDNTFAGGYAEIYSLGASTNITDPVGTIKLITASDATNKTFTAAFNGAVTNGDRFRIYPPKGFYQGEFATNAAVIVLTATTNGPLQVEGWDFDLKEVHVQARYHQFATDIS